MNVARSRRARGQAGETLLEGLISIVILALVAAASYAGLRVALAGSGQHHDIAVAETVLRSAAEVIQDPAASYIPLAGCGTRPTYSGLPISDGFDPIEVEVSFWTPPVSGGGDPVGTDFGAPGSCPAEDPGLQRITLSVDTPQGHTQTIDFLKRGS